MADSAENAAAERASVEPFVLAVPEAEVDDLRARLRRVRLPEREPVGDWSQGIPRAYVAELCAYWLEEYDWRRFEGELNSRGQWRTVVDGLGIHFLHVRSDRPDARPLLITHGWPGSVVEFLDVLDALVDPPAGEPAFHVVAPSLPGFGFSDKPAETGWGVERIADAWAVLMSRLGYGRFLAQGGDWGAFVTTALAIRHPGRVEALHTTMPLVQPPSDFAPERLGEPERASLDEARAALRGEAGYMTQQATRPQTLGYGLADSPAGQLAWIVEKFHGWTDCAGHPENAVSRQRLLDNASVYWFGASGASSARLYWESSGSRDMVTPVTVPSAVSMFPKEPFRSPRTWVQARYRDLRYWNAPGKGGHFPSLEVPQTFVAELRAAFGAMLSAGDGAG
ncbi:epoxide hydrolase family protein [Streptomyces sp. NPDC059255]|uniref:epoxide hydrolase family protein n=1 Tax=Streptomyces sp. NPDC059255 TaxID=3346793 RepID=UPI0036912C65